MSASYYQYWYSDLQGQVAVAGTRTTRGTHLPVCIATCRDYTLSTIVPNHASYYHYYLSYYTDYRNL